MPRFISLNNKNLALSTSYKVMYSTLFYSAQLKQIPEWSMLLRLSELRRDNRISAHYLLVRNPYDRLVSFFYDKFKNDMQAKSKKEFQRCQLLFFKHLNIRQSDSLDAIVESFLRVRFDTFIELLPEVIHNGHLRPQSKLLYCYYKNIYEVTKVISVEEDVGLLSNIFEVDISVKKNITCHPPYAELFHSKTYKTVNALYFQDFTVLPYITKI